MVFMKKGEKGSGNPQTKLHRKGRVELFIYDLAVNHRIMDFGKVRVCSNHLVASSKCGKHVQKGLIICPRPKTTDAPYIGSRAAGSVPLQLELDFQARLFI